MQPAEQSVSRRHAAIINFPSDVWLVDLGSARGTGVDNQACTRRHLDGVHKVKLGEAELTVASRKDLLI